MDISIFGKSYFTEDGFDIESYTEHDLNRSICKVNGNSFETQQIAIVTANSNKNYMPIIATYGKCIAPLVSPQSYLEHFKGEGTLIPTINGVIARSDDEVKIVGYGNRLNMFLAVESADKSLKGLICTSSGEIFHNKGNIMSVLLEILGAGMKMFVIDVNDEENYEAILGYMYSLQVSRINIIRYRLTNDDNFEVYKKEDDGESGTLKNFVVTL